MEQRKHSWQQQGKKKTWKQKKIKTGKGKLEDSCNIYCCLYVLQERKGNLSLYRVPAKQREKGKIGKPLNPN